MSKFYSNYRKEHNIYSDNETILREEAQNRIHKEHIRQAAGYTTGKHTGSKSVSRLKKNVTMGVRRLKHIYAQYAKAGVNGPVYNE